MTSKLTKKQQQQLQEFDQVTLLKIITDLIDTVPSIREQIINQYFTKPAKFVQKLTTQYRRLLKSEKFYDYYAADVFFDTQIKTLLQPLEKQLSVCPAEVEKLSSEMILSFEQLTNHKDTSSGHWHVYFCTLYDLYLASLVCQTNLTENEIADKIYQIATHDQWFPYEIIRTHQDKLSNQAVLKLRNLFLSDEQTKYSFALSLMIGDITTAKAIWDQHKQHSTLRYLGITEALNFCELLIDQLAYQQAIVVLNDLNDNSTRFNHLDYEKWCHLLVRAMHSEGQHDEALELIKQAFVQSPSHKLWTLYLSIGGDEQRDYPLFLSLAAQSGPNQLIYFLEQMDDYAVINDILTGKREYSINDFKENGFKPERKLSTKLNKLGFYQGAIIIRRLAAESTINYGKSQYYSTAIKDIQKAFEFAINNQDEIWVQSNQDWLMRLYERHSRKYSLWGNLVHQLDGLNIENNQLNFL